MNRRDRRKGKRVEFQELKREYYELAPKQVDGVYNEAVAYWEQRLLNIIYAVFEFTGFREDWSLPYFLRNLFVQGVIAFTDTPLGVLPLRCSFHGINVFDEPTTCIFANKVLGTFERTIGVDCALLRLNWNYSGVMNVVNRYAVMLAMCDSSIAVNLMNTKATMIFSCENEAQKKTAQMMYDEITSGMPAVFVRGDSMSEVTFNKAKENYIASDVQALKKEILSDFLAEFGIMSANTDKRERLITSEVESRSGECEYSIAHMLKNLSDSIETANQIFGLGLSVRLANLDETEEPENSDVSRETDEDVTDTEEVES